MCQYDGEKYMMRKIVRKLKTKIYELSKHAQIKTVVEIGFSVFFFESKEKLIKKNSKKHVEQKYKMIRKRRRCHACKEKYELTEPP